MYRDQLIVNIKSQCVRVQSHPDASSVGSILKIPRERSQRPENGKQGQSLGIAWGGEGALE